MSLLLILCVSSLAFQSTIAGSFFGDIFNGVVDGVKDFANDAKHLAEDASNYIQSEVFQIKIPIQEVAKPVEIPVEKINENVMVAQAVKKNIQDIVVSALEIFQQLINIAKESIQMQINNFAGQVRGIIFQQIDAILQRIQTEVNNMIAILQDKLDKVNIFVGNYYKNIQADLTKWYTEQINQLNSLNVNKQKQAQELLNNFINETNKELKSCLDSIVNDTNSIYNTTIDLTKTQSPTINELATEITNCSLISPDHLTDLSQCIDGELITNLNVIPNELFALQKQLNGIDIENILQFSCLQSYLFNIQTGKINIAIKIQYLILNDVSNDTATPAIPSSSIEIPNLNVTN